MVISRLASDRGHIWDVPNVLAAPQTFKNSDEAVVATPRHATAKLGSVEGVRGVAACLVVFYHLARQIAQGTGTMPFGALTKFGHAGVDMFFVLSGFIILHVHHSDVGRPERAWSYVCRRFTRVYPFYWLVLAIAIAMFAAKYRYLPSTSVMIGDLFLLPAGQTTVGVAWTLQYEILFYSVFLALVLSRPLGLALAGTWITLIVLVPILPRSIIPTPFQMVASPYCTEFFMGMAAELWLRQAAPARPRLLLAAGIAGFVCAATCEDCSILDGYGPLARAVYGMSMVLALVGLVEAERRGHLRPPSIVTKLGNGSYAIYLTHLLLIGLLWKLFTAAGLGPALMPRSVMLILIGGLSIYGGLLVSRYVEQPLTKLIRTAWGPRLRSATATASFSCERRFRRLFLAASP